MVVMPIKFRILQLIHHNEGISNEELLTCLKKEYSQDRMINERGIEDYLISLKTVGMIELIDIMFDINGKLKQFYKITKYGIDRMKYVDDRGQTQIQKMEYSA